MYYGSADSLLKPSIFHFLLQITLLQMEHNFEIVSMIELFGCKWS